MTNTDRDAANAIMAALAATYGTKLAAWKEAERVADEAGPVIGNGRDRARYDRNVAHGECLGAMEALYAARKVFNDHFSVHAKFVETAV